MFKSEYIDFALLAYMIFCVIWGYFSGGINEIFSLAGLLIILAISLRVYGDVAAILVRQFAISNVAAYICAFIAVFIAVYTVLKILKWLVNKQISSSAILTSANKTAGMTIGFFKSGLVTLIIGVSLLLLPLNPQHKAIIEGSFFVAASKICQPFIMGFFGDRQLMEAANQIASNPEKHSAAIANSPQIQNIVSHHKVQEIANDPEIKQAVLNKDFTSLMSNQKFLSLMNDPEILQMIKGIDLNQLVNSANADSTTTEVNINANAPDITNTSKILNGADNKAAKTGEAAKKNIETVKKVFENILSGNQDGIKNMNLQQNIQYLPAEEKK